MTRKGLIAQAVGLLLGWVLVACLWVWAASLFGRVLSVVKPWQAFAWLLGPTFVTALLLWGCASLLRDWTRYRETRDGDPSLAPVKRIDITRPTRILIPAIPLLALCIVTAWLRDAEARTLATLWVVMIVWALVWLPFLLRSTRRYERRVAGRCPQCGYDLRASNERCPEMFSLP